MTWFLNLSIRSKLSMGFGLIIMLLAVAIGVGYRDIGYLLSDDGFATYPVLSKSAEVTPCVSFIFESGEIWGVDAYLLNAANDTIPLVIDHFATALDRYSRFLQHKLAVPGPYRWIAGIEGVKGRPLLVSPPPGKFLVNNRWGSCLTDVLVGEGTHSPGAPTEESLRPFIAKVFAKCGVDQPDWINQVAATAK